MLYPQMEQKMLIRAWAAHVEDGIASLRNHKSLRELALAI
jgi:DNA sulfur modification protein DndE